MRWYPREKCCNDHTLGNWFGFLMHWFCGHYWQVIWHHYSVHQIQRNSYAIRIHRFRHSSAYYTRRNAALYTMVGPYIAKRLPSKPFTIPLQFINECPALHCAHTIPKYSQQCASIFLAIRTIRDTNNKIRINVPKRTMIYWA